MLLSNYTLLHKLAQDNFYEVSCLKKELACECLGQHKKKKCSMLLSVWHYSLVLTTIYYTASIHYNDVVRCNGKRTK